MLANSHVGLVSSAAAIGHTAERGLSTTSQAMQTRARSGATNLWRFVASCRHPANQRTCPGPRGSFRRGHETVTPFWTRAS